MKVRIHNYTWIGDEVSIGDGSKIQAHAFIPNGVTIGKNVFVGPGVVFCNDLYPRAKGNWSPLKTVVEDGASIGANSTILCGVRIGKDAMIGCGSVVIKDVPRGETWAGNPARRISENQ